MRPSNGLTRVEGQNGASEMVCQNSESALNPLCIVPPGGCGTGQAAYMTKRDCLGIRVFIFLILFSVAASVGRAQPLLPPDPYAQLCTWSFDDPSWSSDLGYPPASFTNLNNPPSFDGN